MRKRRWLLILVGSVVSALLIAATCAPKPYDKAEQGLDRFLMLRGFKRDAHPKIPIGGLLRGRIIAAYSRTGQTIEQFNSMNEELRIASLFDSSAFHSQSSLFVYDSGEYVVSQKWATYYYDTKGSWGEVGATVMLTTNVDGTSETAVMAVRDVRSLWSILREVLIP